MEKHTIRLLTQWECNLACDYCCNELEEVRRQIKPISMKDIDWCKYKNVCISGGEPFLSYEKLCKTLSFIPRSKPTYIYTNGVLVTPGMVRGLKEVFGVAGFNVGLHIKTSFDKIISKLRKFPEVRFHVEDIHKEYLDAKYEDIQFHYWHRNDCDVPHEDVFILK